MAKKKLRPLGDISADLEPLLFEMSIDHDMQHQEVMAQIYYWLEVHVKKQAPVYITGDKPDLPSIFGFKPELKRIKSNERRKRKTKS